MPSSVRRSIRASPPSSIGPCRIAVGILLEYPSFCSIEAGTLDWIGASSSSSTASVGRTYLIAGAYMVQWNIWMSVGVSFGDLSRMAKVSALSFSIYRKDSTSRVSGVEARFKMSRAEQMDQKDHNNHKDDKDRKEQKEQSKKRKEDNARKK